MSPFNFSVLYTSVKSTFTFPIEILQKKKKKNSCQSCSNAPSSKNALSWTRTNVKRHTSPDSLVGLVGKSVSYCLASTTAGCISCIKLWHSLKIPTAVVATITPINAFPVPLNAGPCIKFPPSLSIVLGWRLRLREGVRRKTVPLGCPPDRRCDCSRL